MALYCLVFTSVAKHKVTDDDLKAILNKSRISNAALGITGMLLYLDPYFMQVLEVEEEALDEKFSMIARNPIHHKISLIYKQPIQRRSFDKWSMGFNKVGIEHFEGVKSLHEVYCDDVFKKNPSEVLELLRMFKNETLF